MYEKQKYLLKKKIEESGLDKILDRNKYYFIAGGACTSVFSNQPIKDLDIFFLTEKDYLEVKETIHILIIRGEIIASYFETDCAYSFTLNNVRIQLIKKLFGKVNEVIHQFDFTICQCAFIPYGSYAFIMLDNFLSDLAQKELKYNIDSKYPITSLWRTKKFLKKGFNLAAVEYLKLALAINNLNIKNYIDLKEQLEGIDTLFLKDLTDKMLESSDKEYDIKEALNMINSYLESKFNLEEE